jgi:hypothetical protein
VASNYLEFGGLYSATVLGRIWRYLHPPGALDQLAVSEAPNAYLYLYLEGYLLGRLILAGTKGGKVYL